NGTDGDRRFDAGLWAADLHMAQGRFGQARAIVAAIQTRCREDDAELRGDLARLLHLADRFSYDFDAALRHLDEAARWYETSGSVFGRSAVLTNRAELLAWTDPEAAVEAATEAIDVQQELGALHELGKAYTALALAQVRMGLLQEAAASLDLACDALERARYRSGRARAELVRAFVHARRGLPAKAAEAVRAAVRGLVATEVYPTLILLAARLLDVLGVSDPMVTDAARHARSVLDGDHTEVTAARVTELLGMDPPSLFREALDHPDAAAGFYNRNVRVGPVLVRAPIAGADGMDLRIWPEHEVLAALAPHVECAPRLRFTSVDPPFQVHDFVDGTVLDALAPRGVRVPAFVLHDVVALFRSLAEIPFRELPPVPFDWAADGDTVSFARRLSAITGHVHARFRDSFAAVFAGLGVPVAPLQPVHWETLTSRPFCLVHADVHRKNMILEDGRTFFLDWELALWGDPVYELAVHLHKMAYFGNERDALLRAWLDVMTPAMVRSWETDLETYLAHERVKSAIVDTVRYTQLIASGELPPEEEHHLLEKLTGKLNSAGRYWGWSEPIEQARTEYVVRRHRA
ncbi:MAG TPA: phosphotransferase, partial [Thermomonospora sp.]|nr:phosphotransferase [Thermomonospora sp.]